jgi:hypothetical protein
VELYLALLYVLMTWYLVKYKIRLHGVYLVKRRNNFTFIVVVFIDQPVVHYVQD